MRQLIVLFVLAILGCSSKQTPAQDHWHQLASRAHDLTSTIQGIAWEQKMLPMHNSFWPQVFSICSAQANAAGVTSFKAVAVINNSGVITDYLLEPGTPNLDCFTTQMIGRKYPAPPQTPFYENFTVNLDPTE